MVIAVAVAPLPGPGAEACVVGVALVLIGRLISRTEARLRGAVDPRRPDRARRAHIDAAALIEGQLAPPVRREGWGAQGRRQGGR